MTPDVEPPDSPEGAAPAVTERFYAELREIAERLFAGERRDHTLQPTAVVHEACVRMLTSSPLPEIPRCERLALGARILRQVLVDHHRKRGAEKRGGQALKLDLDPEVASATGTDVDFEAIHAALERLRALHARQSEVVALRVFGGLSPAEVADALGVSRRTVEADWTVARAWLRRELGAGASPAEAE